MGFGLKQAGVSCTAYAGVLSFDQVSVAVVGLQRYGAGGEQPLALPVELSRKMSSKVGSLVGPEKGDETCHKKNMHPKR